MIALKLKDAVVNLHALAGRVPEDVWQEIKGIAREIGSVVTPALGLEMTVIAAAMPKNEAKPEQPLQ